VPAAAFFGDGDDGSEEGADAWRLELLLRHLGVAGHINPTQQQGALTRLLAAFRRGQLGKYCLDAEVLPAQGQETGSERQQAWRQQQRQQEQQQEQQQERQQPASAAAAAG
jgi:hypothetical protein